MFVLEATQEEMRLVIFGIFYISEISPRFEDNIFGMWFWGTCSNMFDLSLLIAHMDPENVKIQISVLYSSF